MGLLGILCSDRALDECSPAVEGSREIRIWSQPSVEPNLAFALPVARSSVGQLGRY